MTSLIPTHTFVILSSLLLVTAACKPFGDLGSINLDTDATDATEPNTDGATSLNTDGPTEPDPTEGEPQGPPDEWDAVLTPQAGLRLRPIVRTADDGSTQHVAWHDTQENIRCTFRSDESGVQRCFPEHTAVYVFYADPACKVPVMRTFDGYPHDVLELRDQQDLCQPGTYYRLDAEPFVGQLYDINGDGGCDAHSQDPGYYKGTELPHDTFVAAAFAPAEGVSRVVPILLDAEDGAQAIVGAWDREHGEEVAAEPGATSPEARWFARYPARSPKLYSDAACTDRIAGVADCTPASRPIATAESPRSFACAPQVPQRWRLDQSIDPPTAFQGDACNQTETYYWDQLWSLGEALTDDDFGLAPTTTLAGTRLQRAMYANPEGEPILAAASFFDPALGEPCTFSYDPVDGSSTCRPQRSGQLSGIFFDEECTQEVAYVIAIEDCPDPVASWAVGPNGSLRPLLEKTEWGNFKLENGACVVADGDFDYPGGLGFHSVYTVGPTVAFSLVTATDIVQ